LIVALTFGLTTLAWPYAKSLFSDPLSGLLLLTAAYTLLKSSRGAGEQGSKGDKNLSPAPPLLRPPARVYPFLAGLCLGWNVATRYAEALFLPVFGILLLYYLLYALRTTHYALRTTHYLLFPALAFAVPIIIIGLALIIFNVTRYGDPFNTGYLPNETFSGVLWQGLIGQLFSPGRGLFLDCPIFLLSLVGFLPFFRRHRPEAITALTVILLHLLLYGKWFMWHGGDAWGPRFLVPTLPFWAILLAPVAEQAFNRIVIFQASILPTSTLRLLFLTLTTLGLIPQLLSVAIDFGPFQNSLLDTGLPLFDPQTFFDPQHSPFLGAWKFITLDSLDLAWAWQGQVNGWLLLVLVLNIILAAYNLRISGSANQQLADDDSSHRTAASSRHHVIVLFLTLLSTLSAVAFLLFHTHALPAQPLTQAVTVLNEGVRPIDAVITNDPEAAQSFAELYKGRAPVLGLQTGGFPLPDPATRRVNETIAAHRQIWWLPNGLPPEQSAVEQMLMAAGFRARNDNFDGQRLVLFAYPPHPGSHTVAPQAKFNKRITLLEAAYPSETSAGTALPIELHWQTQAALNEEYHVFIHLVDGNGRLIAQADGQPALWTRPTTGWVAGATIVDRHGLWIPPQTTPGNYEVQVGLYRPADGQRLPLTTGEEWVTLGVKVE
jgi:hypothetical protein